MQIENILSLLGVISVAGSYVVLLLGVGVIDSESGKSLYLLGGVIGVLIGMGLMGFAKLIRTQAQSLKQLEDIVKLARVQVRHLDEIRKAAVGEVAAPATPPNNPPPLVTTKVAPKPTPAVKPAPKQPIKPA